MSASLVGSEMCIRDSVRSLRTLPGVAALANGWVAVTPAMDREDVATTRRPLCLVASGSWMTATFL
eukprot:13526850-Alexandrium_andersonii.AAC.1